LDGKICLEKPYSSLVIGVTGISLQQLFNAGHFIEQYIIHVLIVYEVITICFLLLFVYYCLVNIANTKNRLHGNYRV
jgi:hypothetical protein